MAKILINGTDFSTPLVKNEAERISYGDSNVKVALDSLNSNLSSLLVTETKQLNSTASTQTTSVAKSGYTAIGVAGYALSNTNANVTYLMIENNNIKYRTSANTELYANVLYLKTI